MLLPQAQNDMVWTLIGSPWGLAGIWLILINLITFLVFGLDKWKAKRREKRETVRRIPERTLFLLAAAGGSFGALAGMRVWHHKTLHRRFRWGIPALLVLQCLLVLGGYVYFRWIR